MQVDIQGKCDKACQIEKDIARLKEKVKITRKKVKTYESASKRLQEFIQISRPHICEVRDILVCPTTTPSEEELVDEEDYFF